MLDNLEEKIESILFVAGEPVDISDICSKIDAEKSEVLEASKNLQKKYGENGGLQLQIFNNKLQLSSNPKYAEVVSLVLNPIRERNLSKATLETAAIIAYKQPITRLEIEEIRKVSSDYALNVLLEHGLVEIVGKKDTVGRPTLFGTTDEFLRRFNIESIDELPDYNELLEQIKVIRSSDDRLYNHFEINDSTEEMEKKLDIAMSKIEEKPQEELLNANESEDSLDLKNETQVDDGNDYFHDEENADNEFFTNREEDLDDESYFDDDLV